MFNIIKYEWIKRWKLFLAGLTVFVVVNIDLVSRIINKSSPTILSVCFIALLYTLVMVLFFSHVFRMRSVLFSDEGQLTLTLPLSGYRLLGGKMLAVLIECLAVAVFVGSVCFIDYQVLAPYIPSSLEIDFYLNGRIYWHARGFILILFFYISFLLMVYLSMALSKSIFASLKHGRLMSFVIFVVLSGLLSKMGNLLNGKDLAEYWIWVLTIGVAAVFFWVTGYLLDRKINI